MNFLKKLTFWTIVLRRSESLLKDFLMTFNDPAGALLGLEGRDLTNCAIYIPPSYLEKKKIVLLFNMLWLVDLVNLLYVYPHLSCSLGTGTRWPTWIYSLSLARSRLWLGMRYSISKAVTFTSIPKLEICLCFLKEFFHFWNGISLAGSKIVIFWE